MATAKGSLRQVWLGANLTITISTRMKPCQLLSLLRHAVGLSPSTSAQSACDAPSRMTSSCKSVAWLLAAAIGASLLQPISADAQGQPIQTPLVQLGETWEYDYQPGGMDTAVDWSGRSGVMPSVQGRFTASGAARLGFGGTTDVTTLSYGTDPDAKPITAYFRKQCDIPSTASLSDFRQLDLAVPADEGFVLYCNGLEVWRYNLPSGPITPLTLAFPVPPALAGQLVRTCIPLDALQVGANTIACEVHLSSPSAARLGFDCEILGITGDPIPGFEPIISQDPAMALPGQPVVLTVSEAPASSEYRWKIEGREIPHANGRSVTVPECDSESLGSYTCVVSQIDGLTGAHACKSSPSYVVQCDYPTACDVQISASLVRIIGTADDDDVSIESDSSITIPVVEQTSDHRIKVRFPTLSSPRIVCDLGPGTDILSCDVPAGQTFSSTETARLLGGGQDGDTLHTIDMAGFGTNLVAIGWPMQGPVLTTGSVTCGPQHLPVGCVKVNFSLSPPAAGSSWSAQLSTNAAGGFSGVLPPLPGAGGPTLFTDATFTPTDWSLTTITNASGTGSTVTATQFAGTGNPGQFRNVQHNLLVGTPGNGAVIGFHMKAGATYNPSTQGAITSINYSEDSKNFINQVGDGQAAGLAILQNGKFYRQVSPPLVIPYTSFSNWAANVSSGVLASGLVEITGAGLQIPTSHPDFSASGPLMQFGFCRSNSNNGNFQTSCGIDNWRVELVRAQQPYGGTLVVTTPYCPDQTWTFPIVNGVIPTNLGELWCPTCPPCVQPPAGMGLWLSLDELSGLSTANLASPANPGAHPGTPIFGPGYVAQSRNFGLHTNRVEVPNYPALNPGTGNFSMDCWVRRDSGTNSVEAILDHRGYTAGGLTGWHLALSYGNIIFQMAGPPTATSQNTTYVNHRSTGKVPNDGCWHLLAVTVNRTDVVSGIKMYIDGALAGTGSPAGITGSVDVNVPLLVGSSTVGGNSPFKGGIDEVEFFSNRALTATEVAGLYGAFSSGKCKCVTGWRNLALFNTGVNNTGVTLPAGSVDPHYSLTTSANPSGPGPAAYVLQPFYFPDTALSKWISDESAADGNPGNYVYRQTVDLTDSELSTVNIVGRWACDNDGTVFINGVAVPGSATVTTTGFYAWKSFSITSGFVPGINTIEFRVRDQGGYTGVRVEMTGRAFYCCHEDRILSNLPLRNTGINGAGVLIADGSVDPFYSVTPFGPATYVTSYVHPAWEPNASSILSKWISFNQTAFSSFPTVNYTYTQTCNMTGYQTAGATITGRFAADDACDIYFNNVYVATNTNGYTWTAFTITSGFNPGLNTLEFRVQDIGFAVTGLRVEMNGTAYRCLPKNWFYHDWIADQSTDATQLASLSVSSDDTDGDGQSNFLEYVLGSDPLSAVSTNRPTPSLALAPGVEQLVLTLKVCRPMDRPGSVIGESCGDLVNWEPCDLVSSEAQADGTVQDTFQDVDHAAAGATTTQPIRRGPRFIRIRTKD